MRKLLKKLIESDEIYKSEVYFELLYEYFKHSLFAHEFVEALETLKRLDDFRNDSHYRNNMVEYEYAKFYQAVSAIDLFKEKLLNAIRLAKDNNDTQYLLKALVAIADYNQECEESILSEYSVTYVMNLYKSMDGQVVRQNFDSIIDLLYFYSHDELEDLLHRELSYSETHKLPLRCASIHFYFSVFFNNKKDPDLGQSLQHANKGLAVLVANDLCAELMYADLTYYKGLVLLKMNRNKEAKRCFNELLEIVHLFAAEAVDFFIPYYKLLIDEGEYDKCEKLLLDALPHNSIYVYKLRIYEMLGQIFEKQERYQEAYENSKLVCDYAVKIEIKGRKDEVRSKISKEQILHQIEENQKLWQLNAELDEAYTAIGQSIEYAAIIQRSILPNDRDFSNFFDSFFTVFRPRDVVSGDFIWFHKLDNSKAILAVADCTGHGVPAAFLTIAANAILNNIIKERHINSPAEILNQADARMKEILHSPKKNVSDGMDIALVYIDRTSNELTYSLANSILITSSNDETVQFRGQRKGVGDRKSLTYIDNTIPITPGMKLYLTTDGIHDMAVCTNGKKKRFMTKGMLDFVQANRHLSMHEQQQALHNLIEAATAQYPQRDDIAIAGVEV